MINELLNSWERRSHCENNFGNVVPRRSRWKRSLGHGPECPDDRSVPIHFSIALGTKCLGHVFGTEMSWVQFILGLGYDLERDVEHAARLGKTFVLKVKVKVKV